MGTKVHFLASTTKSLDVEGVRAAMRSALEEIEHVEGVMTSWNDTSDPGASTRPRAP